MANKRQKKKQQKLQQAKPQQKQLTHRQKEEQKRAAKLQRQGVHPDDAKRLQQYNKRMQQLQAAKLQEQRKQEAKRKKARDSRLAREQKKITQLMAAGFTQDEAYKLRGKSYAEITELTAAKQSSGDYMLVFVRDKTGGRVDAITGEGTGEWSEAVYWQKQMSKGLGIKSLLSGINSALEGMDAVGNIGEAVIDVVPAEHIDQTINFRAKQDFFLVYRGQGKSYKALVSLINNVMSFLYLRSQRDVFIRDLHANLYNLGNAAARRNADRIEKEFL